MQEKMRERELKGGEYVIGIEEVLTLRDRRYIVY